MKSCNVPAEWICFADLPSTALIRALVTRNTIWIQLHTDGMLPDHDECNDCGLAGQGWRERYYLKTMNQKTTTNLSCHLWGKWDYLNPLEVLVLSCCLWITPHFNGRWKAWRCFSLRLVALGWQLHCNFRRLDLQGRWDGLTLRMLPCLTFR